MGESQEALRLEAAGFIVDPSFDTLDDLYRGRVADELIRLHEHFPVVGPDGEPVKVNISVSSHMAGNVWAEESDYGEGQVAITLNRHYWSKGHIYSMESGYSDPSGPNDPLPFHPPTQPGLVAESIITHEYAHVIYETSKKVSDFTGEGQSDFWPKTGPSTLWPTPSRYATYNQKEHYSELMAMLEHGDRDAWYSPNKYARHWLRTVAVRAGASPDSVPDED